MKKNIFLGITIWVVFFTGGRVFSLESKKIQKPVKPQSTPVTSQTPKVKPFWVSALLGYGFSRFDLTDATDGSKGTFVTKLSAVTVGTVGYKINQSFSAFFFGQYKMTSFDPPEGGSFDPTSQFSQGLGLGGSYRFDEARLLTLSLSREQELYVRAKSPVSFTTEAAYVQKLRTSLAYNLSGPFTLHPGVFIFMPPSFDGYKGKWGYGGSLGINWAKRLVAGMLLDIGAAFNYTSKDSELFKQTEQELIFKGAMTWDF